MSEEASSHSLEAWTSCEEAVLFGVAGVQVLSLEVSFDQTWPANACCRHSILETANPGGVVDTRWTPVEGLLYERRGLPGSGSRLPQVIGSRQDGKSRWQQLGSCSRQLPSALLPAKAPRNVRSCCDGQSSQSFPWTRPRGRSRDRTAAVVARSFAISGCSTEMRVDPPLKVCSAHSKRALAGDVPTSTCSAPVP